MKRLWFSILFFAVFLLILGWNLSQKPKLSASNEIAEALPKSPINAFPLMSFLATLYSKDELCRLRGKQLRVESLERISADDLPAFAQTFTDCWGISRYFDKQLDRMNHECSFSEWEKRIAQAVRRDGLDPSLFSKEEFRQICVQEVMKLKQVLEMTSLELEHQNASAENVKESLIETAETLRCEPEHTASNGKKQPVFLTPSYR